MAIFHHPSGKTLTHGEALTMESVRAVSRTAPAADSALRSLLRHTRMEWNRRSQWSSPGREAVVQTGFDRYWRSLGRH